MAFTTLPSIEVENNLDTDLLILIDEALNADGVICGVDEENIRFWLLKDSKLDSILTASFEEPLDSIKDLMIEPSMEVKLIVANKVYSFDGLMRNQSWTNLVDSIVPNPRFDFASWFDLMGPFPYTTEVCLARVGQRSSLGGVLCIDQMLGNDILVKLYPPSNWSELRTICDSITSSATFLYFLLDASQSSVRIASFCKRNGLDGAQQELIRAYLAVDHGKPREALNHLLHSRTDSMPDLLLKTIANDSNLLLLSMTAGLPIDPQLVMDAFAKTGRIIDAYYYAQPRSIVESHLIPSFIRSPFWKKLSVNIPPRFIEDYSNDRILAERRAIIEVISLLHSGRYSMAIEVFERWKNVVPADCTEWCQIKTALQLLRDHHLEPIFDQETTLVIKEEENKKTSDMKCPHTSPIKSPKPRIFSSPNKSPVLIRTISPKPTSSPVQCLTPTQSPTSNSAISSPVSPSTSATSRSSPPLRSVLPRHVPANQPSRLANLVESSDHDSPTLERALFNKDIMSDLSDIYEDSDTDEPNMQLLVDNEIRYVCTSSSSVGSPSKKYNLRNLPPVDYSPTRRRRTNPSTPSKQPDITKETPGGKGSDLIESKTQFKRRILADLGLPSPLVKKPRAIQSTKGTPTKKKEEQRAENGEGDVTPPVRSTPPAVSRRRR